MSLFFSRSIEAYGGTQKNRGNLYRKIRERERTLFVLSLFSSIFFFFFFFFYHTRAIRELKQIYLVSISVSLFSAQYFDEKRVALPSRELNCKYIKHIDRYTMIKHGVRL